MSERCHVKIGEAQVAVGEGVLYAIGLGSCVAVILYDEERRIGGLAHVMLPEPTREHPLPGRYATRAVPYLIERMVEAGASAERLFARIAGGAAMFRDVLPAEGARLGDRNVAAVKNALDQANVPLRAEDVGGGFGRSVFFDAHEGSVLIRAVRRDDVLL
jgi:chemotaxis protein CheD